MDLSRFIKDAQENGGLTRSLVGRPVPTSGFMVSCDRAYELTLPVLHVSTLYGWLGRAWPVLNLRNKFVGAWRDGSTWYLDVATWVADEADAQKLAAQHSQLAYWNIAEEKTVYL